jgi:hypothetical protein
MLPQQQPSNQGLDNHRLTEDDFDKSTQEHRSRQQYYFDGNPVTSEDYYRTLTQKHISQKFH